MLDDNIRWGSQTLRPRAEISLRLRLRRALRIAHGCRGPRIPILRWTRPAIRRLGGVRHGCLQERFIVPSRFNELLIELGEFILIRIS